MKMIRTALQTIMWSKHMVLSQIIAKKLCYILKLKFWLKNHQILVFRITLLIHEQCSSVVKKT